MMKRCVLLGVLATVATIFLVFGVSKEISASTEQTGAYELYTSPVGYEDYFSDENPYTPPSENLKINPIYCPALKTGQMPTVDFFEWSLPEKGIYAHTADGTPLYLNGIGGGTVEEIGTNQVYTRFLPSYLIVKKGQKISTLYFQ